MKKLIFAAMVCCMMSTSFTACQENQRTKFYDKVSGDVSGYKLKGYTVYYTIDFYDDSYESSDEQYPIYKKGKKYYIEIDGEKERLHKLDEPIRFSDDTKFKYKTNSDLYIESIPNGY